MSAYPDLGACDYFGSEWASILAAVGWVGARRDFLPNDVSVEFFDALVELLIEPWQPFALAGRHRCSLCSFSGGPGELCYRDKRIVIGAANLFVLDTERVYVAPTLIAHYIDAHQYAPPEEFQRAVLNSPPMKSMAYLKLLRQHGLHRLADSERDR